MKEVFIWLWGFWIHWCLAILKSVNGDVGKLNFFLVTLVFSSLISTAAIGIYVVIVFVINSWDMFKN